MDILVPIGFGTHLQQSTSCCFVRQDSLTCLALLEKRGVFLFQEKLWENPGEFLTMILNIIDIFYVLKMCDVV